MIYYDYSVNKTDKNIIFLDIKMVAKYKYLCLQTIWKMVVENLV